MIYRIKQKGGPMLKRTFFILFFAFLPFLFAQELLTNGDFEQELTVGWVQSYGGTGTPTFARDTFYQPDPDYEAYIRQYDNPGWTRLSQKVDVPGINLILSFWAYFNQSGETTCWPAACFQVCYYNINDSLLGETRYYYCPLDPWTPTPNFHPIRITNPQWNQYFLNIAEELNQNLPGVNPGDVAKVEVALYAYTYSGWGTPWAEVSADEVSLIGNFNRPNLVLIRTQITNDPNNNGILDPGETANLITYLRNLSPIPATNLRGRLRENDPYISISDSLANFGNVPGNDSTNNLSDPFVISALPSTPRNYVANLSLYLVCNETSWTRNFTITVGEWRIIDPIPDGPRTPPRYWAYDDIDTIYSEAPRFNWIEIRDRGVRLPITSDDQTIRITLPFVFKYYGIRYTDSLSICGNGWLSPIRTTLTVYTNYPLPDQSSANPSAMICPNWDDLYPPYGNGIWYLYEPDSHRFIIEWDSVHYFSPNTQWDKFQIIVYDTTVQTYTGDNEFTFQYLTANNYISNTVGIEDETNLIGINALYNNTYHRACAPLTPRRAIKFTTDTVRLVTLREEKIGKAKSRNNFATINRNKIDLNLKSERPLILSIYDINGREVQRFSVSGSVPNLIWNGKNREGKPLPTGIYFIRISGEGVKEREKIIFIR